MERTHSCRCSVLNNVGGPKLFILCFRLYADPLYLKSSVSNLSHSTCVTQHVNEVIQVFGRQQKVCCEHVIVPKMKKVVFGVFFI